MPSQRRQQILQRYHQTLGAIDRALYHLSAIKLMYGDEAPAHRQAVELIALALVQVRQLFEEFRGKYI